MFPNPTSIAVLAILLTDGICLHASEIDFQTQIAPIFSLHCLGCHSPNIKKGDFSLATSSDLEEFDLVDSDVPESSRLLEVITSVDGQPPEMPRDGDPLSTEHVQLIRRWIEEGAKWPDDTVIREASKADATWWSLQPLKTPAPNASIDQFILAKLSESDLAMNPPADRRTLIRRATYDLTGLPPTPEQVHAFVEDIDPLAYEKLIDRLLASPHYGERWGRHWLDVVRFGESNGFERNVIINTLWPFRDYVIDSINADKPFDQFIREHVAGDVIEQDNPDVAVGTAFLVAGPYDDVGNQDATQAAQIRANTLDEIIRATSTAFLGLTVGCARCHDHKFDPITQDDYYSLYATFAGVRHGAVPLASKSAHRERKSRLSPLQARKSKINGQLKQFERDILKRANEKLADYQTQWTRPPVDRGGTEDIFEPVIAKYVRMVCKAQDINPNSASGFRVDEFEIWSADESDSKNVALASNGGKASGSARQIEDFPDAYGPHLTIDGKTGARFIATSNTLSIELAEPTTINRVFFSSGRNEPNTTHRKFSFVAEYSIQASTDGEHWAEVASGDDRKPVAGASVLNRRLLQFETTDQERQQQAKWKAELRAVEREISQVPALPSVWIGRRVAADAKGPFHVFEGGSPQRKGAEVVPTSLASLSKSSTSYQLSVDAEEASRRKELANWLVHPDNPLTPRVLANRLWHYHFGIGIVDTPNDFGYMGGRPSHPELLDYLATKLKGYGWQLKAMHRLIMTSATYQQASDFRPDGGKIDVDSRLLWRFRPRRLSAEEVRDTILHLAGKLNKTQGGPGFRLYHFMQDNVCTYVPLDQHGPETYRRAVYHQNARASIVDLMTEFDQPDCTFSAPKRAATTTPLQALTMLNHSFTLDMAKALAERIRAISNNDADTQIQAVFEWCFARPPSEADLADCRELLAARGLVAVCRAILNTSELIYVH